MRDYNTNFEENSEKEIINYLREKNKKSLGKIPQIPEREPFGTLDLEEIIKIDSDQVDILLNKGMIITHDKYGYDLDKEKLAEFYQKVFGKKRSIEGRLVSTKETLSKEKDILNQNKKTSKKYKLPKPKDYNQIIDEYFKDIENSNGLPAEEEYKLSLRIQKGDLEARNELIEANLRFVVSVAKQYQNNGLPLSDIISAGNVGLITAAERFDGAKGYKFISYAVWWIRQSILQSLAVDNRTVRIPLNRISELTKLKKASNRLSQEYTTQIDTNDILAEELGINAEEINKLEGISQRPSSLDQFIDETEKRATLGDAVPDESQESQEETITKGELKEGIGRILNELSEREADILRMYYGLDDYEAMTLEKIGTTVGLTRERVRQIREIALSKLRQPSKLKKLKNYQ